MFLTKLAEQDQSLRLSSFVVAACREFGWSAFAQELKQLDLIAAKHAWPAGNPVPRRRVALRLLLRQDGGPGQVGARPRIVCAGGGTLL